MNKLVPVEPTEAMIDAGNMKYLGSEAFDAIDIYRAMLQAAPQHEGEAVAWLCDAGDGANIQAVTSTHARDTYAYAGRKITPLYTSPRVVDEAMVQRLAIHMATKESANCTTLDAAVNHINNWKRLVPEAQEMLQAARPDKPAEFVMNESLRSGMKKVMLENQRLRAALDFYADHNHWMSTSENHEPEMLLVAHAGDSVFIHGWDVAQRALAVNHARLGQFIDELFGEEIQAALGEGK